MSTVCLGRTFHAMRLCWCLLGGGCAASPAPVLPEPDDSTVLGGSDEALAAAHAPDESARSAPAGRDGADAAIEMQRYSRAIEAAKTAPLRDDLTRIDLSRSPVLVASVMTEQSFQRYYAYRHAGDRYTAPPEYGGIWVTAVPELQDFCASLEGSRDSRRLRMAQWLGLPPDRERQPAYVVEMKVRPTDLLRPCVDNEVDDSTCNPLPAHDSGGGAEQGSSQSSAEAAYQQWFRSKLWADEKFPFTGRGYTYDWGPTLDGKNRQHPKGASEFILRPNAQYEIGEQLPIERYCRWVPSNPN